MLGNQNTSIIEKNTGNETGEKEYYKDMKRYKERHRHSERERAIKMDTQTGMVNYKKWQIDGGKFCSGALDQCTFLR